MSKHIVQQTDRQQNLSTQLIELSRKVISVNNQLLCTVKMCIRLSLLARVPANLSVFVCVRALLCFRVSSSLCLNSKTHIIWLCRLFGNLSGFGIAYTSDGFCGIETVLQVIAMPWTSKHRVEYTIRTQIWQKCWAKQKTIDKMDENVDTFTAYTKTCELPYHFILCKK